MYNQTKEKKKSEGTTSNVQPNKGKEKGKDSTQKLPYIALS